VRKATYLIILVLVVCGLSGELSGQNTGKDTPADSVVFLSHHSPRKALIYSALFPGLGQIYNNKVWKIPILYGGAGTAFYFLHRNQLYYKKFRELYNSPDVADVYYVYQYTITSKDNLKRGLDLYRSWRDYAILSIAGIYLLNIIDAYVDAYMFEYDVSDDLSLKLIPNFIQTDVYAGAFGLSVKMIF